MELRRALWERLGDDLKPGKLTEILSNEISLSEVVPTASQLLGRGCYGRTVVKIG